MDMGQAFYAGVEGKSEKLGLYFVSERSHGC